MLVAQATQHGMRAQLTNNRKWCGGKQLWPNLRYCPGTHLEKTRKENHEKLQTVDIPTEIWSGHLQNTSEKH